MYWAGASASTAIATIGASSAAAIIAGESGGLTFSSLSLHTDFIDAATVMRSSWRIAGSGSVKIRTWRFKVELRLYWYFDLVAVPFEIHASYINSEYVLKLNLIYAYIHEL